MDLVKRRSYLGGTDIAVICGFSPYKTPHELWQEKTSTAPPEDFDNDYMAIGRELEDGAARLHANRSGLELVAALQEPLRHPAFPFLACNYDRLYYEDVDGQRVLKLMEVKSTVRSVFKSWNGGVPDVYWCQIQHYLGILKILKGITSGVFVIFVLDERKIHTMDVELDEDYVEQMWEYARWWWQRHVIEGYEPELTASEYDDRKEIPGSSVLADDQAMTDYYDLLKLSTQLKPMLNRKEELEARLKTYIKTSERMINPGDSSVMATYARQTRVTIDSKALKAEHPDVFRRYSKSSNTRILRVKSQDL